MRELKSLTNQLAEYRKGEDSGHIFSRIGVLALLFGSVSAATFFICAYDAYTPQSTNAYCLMTSALAHLGIIVGPAAIFALMSCNYRIVPLRFAYILG